jgi:type II secretory pathway pseudopilin PulG
MDQEMTTGHTAVARDANGFSLVETVLAIALLFIVAMGVLPLGLIATTTTENQGHLMARTTEYAQDKMEQLLALSYGDLLSDTRVFPAITTGGSGLTAPGGNANPNAAAVDKYVDYLDERGTLMPSNGGAAPAGWYYRRMWQISFPAGTANLKQITVTATTQTSVGNVGRVPQATLTALKTNPF